MERLLRRRHRRRSEICDQKKHENGNVDIDSIHQVIFICSTMQVYILDPNEGDIR